MTARARFALLIVAAIALAGAFTSHSCAAADPKPTSRPVPAVQHVFVISCDGLRPDVLLRADAPNVRKLMARGTFTLWAKTIPVAITLPSHTSMLTGVYPEKHGISWNDDEPEQGYPKVPTLFMLAKKAGYTTAMATGKSKFATLAKPGSIDWVNNPIATDVEGSEKKKAGTFEDSEVAKQAAAIIVAHQPNVMFIHFPGADRVGHAIGWGTPEQVAVVGIVDAGIGKVIEAIDDAKIADSTVVIISADHGGAAKTHGGIAQGKPIDDARSRHIPWICVGPGIRENYDLTRDATLTVNTVDTFATACFLLGISPGDVDGKPVRQILANPGELLHGSSANDKK